MKYRYFQANSPFGPAESDGHTPSVTILLPRKFPIRNEEVAETHYAWRVIVTAPEPSIIYSLPPG